jgi:hypothetical protein
MNLASHPVARTGFGTDLLLAQRLLMSYENGRMPMDAGAFRDIAAWASKAFGTLDGATLRDLARCIHGPLREVANNVLFIHGDAEWASDPSDNRLAENVWARLHASMKADSARS